MSPQLAAVQAPDAWSDDGPVHRSIIAMDLEGSTKRTNPERGELRRVLYDLLDQSLRSSGILPGHLEPLADRGDGVLILIRPHDEVPKTVLLGRLIPVMTGLLIQHNAQALRPALRLRMRVAVHAGEIHDDGRGFYGEDLDIAFRLLNSPTVKRILRETPASPLVVVVSEEIFAGIVRHRYFDEGRYQRCVHVRVAERQRRGWVHIPSLVSSERPLGSRRTRRPRTSPSLTIATADAQTTITNQSPSADGSD